jgi:hypothetical protein
MTAFQNRAAHVRRLLLEIPIGCAEQVWGVTITRLSDDEFVYGLEPRYYYRPADVLNAGQVARGIAALDSPYQVPVGADNE